MKPTTVHLALDTREKFTFDKIESAYALCILCGPDSAEPCPETGARWEYVHTIVPEAGAVEHILAHRCASLAGPEPHSSGSHKAITARVPASESYTRRIRATLEEDEAAERALAPVVSLPSQDRAPVIVLAAWGATTHQTA